MKYCRGLFIKRGPMQKKILSYLHESFNNVSNSYGISNIYSERVEFDSNNVGNIPPASYVTNFEQSHSKEFILDHFDLK